MTPTFYAFLLAFCTVASTATGTPDGQRKNKKDETAQAGISRQADSLNYGLVKNMPLFYQQLKHQLTYPMAWGNPADTDFNDWKRRARQVLTDCMLNQPPAPASYDMTVMPKHCPMSFLGDAEPGQVVTFSQDVNRFIEDGRFRIEVTGVKGKTSAGGSSCTPPGERGRGPTRAI